MEDLFGELTVDDVVAWCARRPAALPALLAEFERIRDYRGAADWNRLVRVCEALAVLGWADRPPVEARAERWVNGSMYTKLHDHHFTVLDERRWARRATTFVLDDDPGLADPDVTVLQSQRIPLAKNPFRFIRSGNYQADAQPFVDELAALRALLDVRLAKPYGPGFGYVGYQLHFSYADAGRGLASEYFHDDADVVARPDVRPFVRPRLEIGRLTTSRGERRLLVTRHYTCAEGSAALAEQKQGFVTDSLAVVDALTERLAKKAPDYRCAELRADLSKTLTDWA